MVAWPHLMLLQNVLTALFTVNPRVIARKLYHAGLPPTTGRAGEAITPWQ